MKVGIAQRFWKDKLVFTTFLNFNSGHRINHKHTGCGQKMWTRVFLLLIGKIYLITLHSQIATVREPWYHYQGPKKMYLNCIQGLAPLRNHQTMSVRQGRKGWRILKQGKIRAMSKVLSYFAEIKQQLYFIKV